jgi:hypothetical protein
MSTKQEFDNFSLKKILDYFVIIIIIIILKNSQATLI